MPIYDFQCTDCSTIDTRLAAMFEDEATCHVCGGLMRRLSDPFAINPDCPWCTGPESGPPVKSHKICARHAAELAEG
jgi:putative FmdB family regulatory protein